MKGPPTAVPPPGWEGNRSGVGKSERRLVVSVPEVAGRVAEFGNEDIEVVVVLVGMEAGNFRGFVEELQGWGAIDDLRMLMS